MAGLFTILGVKTIVHREKIETITQNMPFVSKSMMWSNLFSFSSSKSDSYPLILEAVSWGRGSIQGNASMETSTESQWKMLFEAGAFS